MRKEFAEFIKAVWTGLVSRLSGPASIVLAVLGFSLQVSDQGRLWFEIAAICCLILTVFSVWHTEHLLRLKMEQDAGPQIFVEYHVNQKGGEYPIGGEYLTFRNVGTEAAQNVEFAPPEGARVHVEMVPTKMQVVHAGESQEGLAVFSVKPRPNETISNDLPDLMRGEGIESIRSYVHFESTKGTRFRTAVDMTKVFGLNPNQTIRCSMSQRELIR
jgi:hypothetical protein